MGRFKSTIFLLIILISLKIMVGSSYSLDVVSAPDGDRLARVEALLETVVNKNQELEKRIEHLETELQVQTKVNDELLDRISELETIKRVNTQSDAQEISENSGHRDENKAVNERSNQTYLWEERQDSPKLRRNHNNNIKRK